MVFSLKERLGSEPSEKQLADFLKISQVDLQTKQMECTMAREKLTLSNIRLVMSVAQKYKHMGADMSDLIQVSVKNVNIYNCINLYSITHNLTLCSCRVV